VLSVEPRTLPGVDPESRALRLFPGGTSGIAKPVDLSHRNVVAAARQVGAALGYAPRDVLLAIAPFFHVMGFVVTGVAPLAAGAKLVTLPRFGFEAMLAAVERHRVTVL
jgi:acyl-CoA synthetase (AMP-forming)/AMP-acid ligase II